MKKIIYLTLIILLTGCQVQETFVDERFKKPLEPYPQNEYSVYYQLEPNRVIEGPINNIWYMAYRDCELLENEKGLLKYQCMSFVHCDDNKICHLDMQRKDFVHIIIVRFTGKIEEWEDSLKNEIVEIRTIGDSGYVTHAYFKYWYPKE